MIPEPELSGLDEFRAFMQERGLLVRREYQPPYEGDEVGYWQVFLVREERRFDDKLYMHVLTVDDRDIIQRWQEQWGLLVELVQAGFEHTLEENGVSDEDGRIHEIREMLETPDWQLTGLDGHFHFLLAVVERLKQKERLLSEELMANWRKAAEDRYALQQIDTLARQALGVEIDVDEEVA